MEKSTEEKVWRGKNPLLNLELLQEARITLHFTLVDDILYPRRCAPTARDSWMGWRGDGLGAQEPWALCLDPVLESPHTCPAWGLFTQVLRRHPGFGSTLVGFEGEEECLGCAFFPWALLDAVANQALGLGLQTAAVSSEQGKTSLGLCRAATK